MINFTFQTDEETIRLFQIVIWCLQKYFSYKEDSAVAALNDYYEKNANRHDDDFYHHEMPFRVATRIYYADRLKGDIDNLPEWIRGSNYNCYPSEVNDYFNEHYFVK